MRKVDGRRAVDEYELHLRRRQVADSSRSKMLEAVEAFCGSFLWWDEVTTRQLERWLDARRGRSGGALAPRTRYWWLSALHGFYAWALDEGLVAFDPTVRAVRPRLPELAARPLAGDDVDVVLALTEPGPRRTAMVLMVYGGLRCCEVVRLRWRDVDEAHRRMRVVGKGNRVRWVPVSAYLALALPERGRGEELVIGRRWSASSVSREVATQLRACGVDATAHQLRHTMATDVYDASHDMASVQEMLGHASIATTRIYVRVPARRVHEVMDATDRARDTAREMRVSRAGKG